MVFPCDWQSFKEGTIGRILALRPGSVIAYVRCEVLAKMGKGMELNVIIAVVESNAGLFVPSTIPTIELRASFAMSRSIYCSARPLVPLSGVLLNNKCRLE
jgi:hypothetical protein